ncbi:hypothetical protein MCOR03_011331 [Pyricularia oryzae]|nr:hypothetical protein MCOR26_011258 [Pyricularia oryzae]KAI6310667.1 hypothetical protein MCOR30_011048 [Pyricularia oryzae]KAI6333064.1 hypothetical protein MCOR28_010634 [Pyricularia oryzae]KAI6547489.1 hypothetical protein MCOR03_011331 [Pyricularia oryzae]KAI6589632.1 hypothetical protein MCOR12_008710 [Pyricularia oryzae]
MHHAIIRPTSPRSPTLDTVDSSKTWHQTGPYDLESASAASQTRTVFTLPAWEESRDKQANDQTVMVGTGPSHSERQSLEAVQTIETEERTEDDSARERADHQQSAPQYASSSRYSSFSDKSVRDGQQQGVYRLENIRLHYVSTEAAEQDATAMGAQTSEIQDQSKRRDVLFGLWNEISCDFAAKARLLRFDSRLAESSRAPLAVALDQMEAYHFQVVKYCMMHVDGFLDCGFNCFLTEEKREEDNADSPEKAKDQDCTLSSNQVCTRTQALGLGIDCCAHHLVKDSPKAGHEVYSEDGDQGHVVFGNSPEGTSNDGKGETPSRSGTGGQTTADSRQSSIAMATENSGTIPTSVETHFSAVSRDGISTNREVSTISDHSPEEARNSERT